jgi:hypothetical protein
MREIRSKDNRIFKEKEFENLNKWLVAKGRQSVENPFFQEVPDDCDIKDFENGVFSQSLYTARKQAEREKKKGDLVEMYIRERYSVSDELAILRQRYEKPEEFEEYNAYAEECKEKAKGEINK